MGSVMLVCFATHADRGIPCLHLLPSCWLITARGVGWAANMACPKMLAARNNGLCESHDGHRRKLQTSS